MSLLNNLKSFVNGKTAAKVVTPKQKADQYVEKMEASDSVKTEATRLVRQAETTRAAVKGNMEKAEARKKAESNDQVALNKLMVDLETIAVEVVTNQEKTKVLHSEASALEESNKEVISQLGSVSFSTIIAATKAAPKTTPAPKAAVKVQGVTSL